MEQKHGFKSAYIIEKLKEAELKERTIELMDRQLKKTPWHVYKKRMITDKRKERGVKFYREYPNTLRRAEVKYGVTSEVIAAILGIETNYGDYVLKHSALDALATLSFHYPRRAAYFKGELEHLFVFSRKNGIDPADVLSSYAGAVGIPQFMPSNVSKYGVDFGGNGNMDLIGSKPDAIGSIAKYLKNHGWERNKPIAVKAYVRGNGYKKFLGKGIKPKYSVRDMERNGIRPSLWVDPSLKGALITLEKKRGSEYWIVFQNFYAITRYNHSINYAMAVTILSKHIEYGRR